MKFSSVHFIGIGGAGMAPLAAILLERGVAVSGSDRELNAKTARLATAGAKIFAGHDATHLPDSAELVVYSSAVPPENPERRRAVERGIPQLRRGELLAELAGEYRRVVAISGSHGKTSITAMLVHALRGCGFTPGFLIGAALRNGPSASAGRGGDLFITEVDESDGTHTLVAPFLGIVPNLDDDHAWSVGGEEALHENFRTFARRSRKLLYYGAPLPDRLFGFHPDAIRLERRDDPCGPWTGFQAWNARLAFHGAELLGVDPEQAERALADFPGVARRLAVRFDSPELVIVEDYAHHPAELASSIATLRRRWPDRELQLVFQPHRYARLARYLDEFAAELADVDSALVTDVFAAWSETGPVGAADLAAAAGDRVRHLSGSWKEIAAAALAMPAKRPRLLAVVGAGDIEHIFNYLPNNVK